MKRCVACLAGCLLVLLCACGAPPAEEVFTVQNVPMEPPPALRYTISVELPRLEKTEQTEDRCLYEAEDGSCWACTQIFRCSAREALEQLTGRDPERLALIRTRRMGMEEYRFSWCAEGEEGAWLCTGDLLEDGQTCYVLAVCLREQTAKEDRQILETALETFSLNYDEGF